MSWSKVKSEKIFFGGRWLFNRLRFDKYNLYSRWTFAISFRRAYMGYEDGDSIVIEIYLWKSKLQIALWKLPKAVI